MTEALDNLIRRLGSPGCFQIILWLLLSINEIPIIYSHLAMAFFGAKSSHQCKIPHFDNSSALHIHPEACAVQIYNLTSGRNYSTSCTQGWVYDRNSDEETIISEWNLVCWDSYLVSLSNTIYFVGVMLGGLMWGVLADKFGRKPVLLLCLYIPIILGTSLAFANSFILFVVLRFLIGQCLQGLQVSAYVMVMELFLSKHRAYAGAGVELFISVSVMTLAGIAYFLRNWRYIQLAISLPSLLTLPYIIIIPESLRWLLLRGKFDKAEKIMKRFAAINKVDVPKELFEEVKNEMTMIKKQASKEHGLTDILRTQNLRKISLILFLNWFTASCGYFGISFKVSDLLGNKYLNLFIAGVFEFFSYLSVIYAAGRFGRRRSIIFYLMIGAITCIAAGSIPSSRGEIYRGFTTALAIIGRCGFAAHFSMIFLYTAELYPTTIRNIGVGACSFWARLGSVLAPQINILGYYLHPSVPFIVYGAAAFSSACLVLLLPETLNQKLPDTIVEVEVLKNTELFIQHEQIPLNENTGQNAEYV